MYPKFSPRLLWLSLFCITFALAANAQTAAPSPALDVVRTEVELVQTDITVFDRHGKFVGSIQPEHFTLSVDGKKRPLSLISRIMSGSQTEAEQLNALQANAKKKTSPESKAQTPLSRPGRLIFFFVDDIHLSPDGVSRSRKALTQFIEKQMGQDDQVAIVSSSGRIGFLQQLTDNRVVLHTAINRLGNARRPDEYIGRNKITEQMLSQMRDSNNSSLFHYLDGCSQSGVWNGFDASQRESECQRSTSEDLTSKSSSQNVGPVDHGHECYVASPARAAGVVRKSARSQTRFLCLRRFHRRSSWFQCDGSSEAVVANGRQDRSSDLLYGHPRHVHRVSG